MVAIMKKKSRLLMSLLLSQLLCAGVASAVQTCPSYIPDQTPNSRYTIDASKSTVLDNDTGLMWQQCSLGFSGSDCTTGSATRLTWQGALQAGVASTQGGYNDWRLPNKKELHSLVAGNCVNPSINQSVFPNTVSGVYWSSSPYANYSISAWSVYFYDGYDGSSDRTISYRVRLVR